MIEQQQTSDRVSTPKITWATRWRLKRQWYSSCYSFNWAHHPLCENFRKDVLRIGNFHFCRSCTCVYFGIFITIASLLFWFEQFQRHPLVTTLAVILPTLLLSFPKIYKWMPRYMRDFARIGMGATLVITASLFLSSYWPLALGLAAALFCFWRYYFRLRKVRRANACQNCSEYRQRAICSGTAIQIASLRKYEEAATEILYASFE